MRYFFDLDSGYGLMRDEVGVEATHDQVRLEAISILPDIARQELPDGDHHTFRVSVRDETDQPVFKATLTLDAGWIGNS